MKYNKLISGALAVVFGVILLIFGTVGVFADNDDNPSVLDEPTETEYIEPETEPFQPETEAPQPETEPFQPDTEAPQPETEAPQPETEPAETEAPTEERPTDNFINNIIDPDPDTTYFNPPTVPKTVSQKTYSTNYVFGITSWICVGVGIIVILAVAISTKVGGRSGQGIR